MDQSLFLVTWDTQGVEHFQDITDLEPDAFNKAQLMDVIKGEEVKPNPLGKLISHLSLRARFNSQRFYECYIFRACGTITFDTIEEWFHSDPQGFADWVRANHSMKVFDYRTKDHSNPVIR